MIIDGLSTSLSLVDRSSGQKNKKNKIKVEKLTLNSTTNQMERINIYRTLHPNNKGNILFSGDQETFSKRDHILRHKVNHTNIEKLKYHILDYSVIQLRSTANKISKGT